MQGNNPIVRFEESSSIVQFRGCQFGMQGPQLCAKPGHFCILDMATYILAFLDLNLHVLQVTTIEEGILEAKTDCSAKDLLFLACVAFCVINFEPIMI